MIANRLVRALVACAPLAVAALAASSHQAAAYCSPGPMMSSCMAQERNAAAAAAADQQRRAQMQQQQQQAQQAQQQRMQQMQAEQQQRMQQMQQAQQAQQQRMQQMQQSQQQRAQQMQQSQQAQQQRMQQMQQSQQAQQQRLQQSQQAQQAQQQRLQQSQQAQQAQQQQRLQQSQQAQQAQQQRLQQGQQAQQAQQQQRLQQTQQQQVQRQQLQQQQAQQQQAAQAQRAQQQSQQQQVQQQQAAQRAQQMQPGARPPFGAGFQPGPTALPGQPRPGGSLAVGGFAAGAAAGTAMGAMAPRPNLPPAAPVRVGSTTVARPDPAGQGMQFTRRVAPHQELVINTRAGQGAQQQVAGGYLRTHNPALGTTTQLFVDGRRVVTGPGYVSRSAPGGPVVLVRNNGVREVSTPTGQRLFVERPAPLPARPGLPPQTGIVRTVYGGMIGGRPVQSNAPIIQHYEVATVYGARTERYRWGFPPARTAAIVAAVLTPFVAPTALAVYCPQCVGAVAFESPVGAYSEPTDMLADMQLAAPFDDVPIAYTPGPDPAVAAQIAALQVELDSEMARNAALQASLGGAPIQFQPVVAPPPRPVAAARAPVPISTAAREQVRGQVRDALQHARTDTPLALTEIIEEAHAQDYLFQVAEPLNASIQNSSEACQLTAGDLVKFDSVPTQSSPVAAMKVVTSRPDDCRAQSVVMLSLPDLQNMLNAFSQRLEQNMQLLAEASRPATVIK